MAKPKTSDQWGAFLEKLGPVRTGERTFTLSEAARECGVVDRALRKAVMSGRIPKQDLRQGEWGKGKKIALFTQQAIDNYRLSRVGLQPLTEEETGAPAATSSMDEQFAHLPPGMPDNLADAKLRVEQLKIERLEAENMLARNQTMRIEDVIAANKETDMELIAALRSMVYRAAPRLAAETDVLRCRTILEQEIQEAMSVLERTLINGTPEA